MRILRCMLVFVCSTLYYYPLLAQTTICNNSLRGAVRDAVTGLPVSDAAVYILEQGKGTYTDSNGEYKINAICSGRFTLICKHINHEEQKETLVINNELEVKNIYISCHKDTLHEVAIKRARIHWENVTVSHTLQAREIYESSGLNLGKALERVNGVYSLNTGANISKPVIRGMHSNRIQILNNGIRQEGQQWGNEHAPEIDVAIAHKIDVIKGAQSIRYGNDVIGGAVLVMPTSSKDIDTNLVNVISSYQHNGKTVSLSANWRHINKREPALRYMIHASTKRGGNTHAPTYYLNNTGQKELNYAATIGYVKPKWSIELFHSRFETELGILSSSHIGNLTDLYRAFSSSEPQEADIFTYRIQFPKQVVSHKLYKMLSTVNLNKTWRVETTYGLQHNKRKEYDRNLLLKNDDGTYRPVLNFDLQTQSIDASLLHKPIRSFEGSVGINGFYQTNDYYGNYFIPNYERFQGGIYATEKWHKGALSLEGGVRYDVNTFQIHKWENNRVISPSHVFNGVASTLAGRYQFRYIALHAQGGTTWRAPFVNELYSFGVHQSAASFEVGNRTLQPERCYNASLTVDFAWRKKVDAELTFHYNYMHNYIALQPQLPATLTIRGAFPTFTFIQTDARFAGIEYASSFYLPNQVIVHTKAATLWAKDIRRNSYLVGMPPTRFEISLESPLYEQKQMNIKGSIAANYTARQNRVLDSQDYVPSPKSYSLLNADIAGSFTIGKQPFNVSVGAYNILNTRYREYLNRNRYFADEMGRNIYLRTQLPISY